MNEVRSQRGKLQNLAIAKAASLTYATTRGVAYWTKRGFASVGHGIRAASNFGPFNRDAVVFPNDDVERTLNVDTTGIRAPDGSLNPTVAAWLLKDDETPRIDARGNAEINLKLIKEVERVPLDLLTNVLQSVHTGARIRTLYHEGKIRARAIGTDLLPPVIIAVKAGFRKNHQAALSHVFLAAPRITISQYVRRLKVEDKIDGTVIRNVMPKLVADIEANPTDAEAWRPAIAIFSAYLQKNYPLEKYLINSAGSHNHKRVVREAGALCGDIHANYTGAPCPSEDVLREKSQSLGEKLVSPKAMGPFGEELYGVFSQLMNTSTEVTETGGTPITSDTRKLIISVIVFAGVNQYINDRASISASHAKRTSQILALAGMVAAFTPAAPAFGPICVVGDILISKFAEISSSASLLTTLKYFQSDLSYLPPGTDPNVVRTVTQFNGYLTTALGAVM